MAPVIIKASCQPYKARMVGTKMGAKTAPILAPELKIPVAKALSFFGNHSATVLMAAGKLPDSPKPRAALAIPKPNVVFTTPCKQAAILQKTIEILKPILVPILSIILPNTSNPRA